MPIASLSAADLAQVVRVYASALREHREALNRLNVYPVPDGDTGTNMALTLESVQKELDEAQPPDLFAVTDAMSHGSLMGARGNSGVILSQILRGMANEFREDAPEAASAGVGGSIGPAVLAEAFSRASFSAYAAVSSPVEGTILTVARAGAQGAAEVLSAVPGATVAEVLEGARHAAAEALAGTTEQLAALKSAGVVDAGGAGLLLLFDSFRNVVSGVRVPPPPAPAERGPGTAPEHERPRGAGPRSTAQSGPLPWADLQRGIEGEPGVGSLRYEVIFLLEAPDEAVPAFRSVWASYGGSIVIVGGDGLYNCHIHTDDVGGAIEAAIEIGRPRQIRVTDLTEQVEEERWVREGVASGEQEEPPAEPVNCAVVAVCAGEGVRRIFRSLGARQVVEGGQSANPSTAEILEAIEAANAEEVIVLPNNANVVPVAEQAACNSAKKVRVVPTVGIPEGFAALLAYDPEADVSTNADNMTSAAARVLSGEVAQAARDATTSAGRVRAGDWLGMSRDGVKVVAPAPSGPADAAIALLTMLVPEPGEAEIVTIIEGEGAHGADTRRIVSWLSEERPGVTAEVHHGGQPLYPYLFSIE